MVLAEPVYYSGGMLLAGAGVALTPAMIERMGKTGIGSLMVEGEDGDSGGELRAVRERLPFLFRRHRRDAFMMTLYNMLQRYFDDKLALAEVATAARKAEKQAAAEAAAGSEHGSEHDAEQALAAESAGAGPVSQDEEI